MEKGSLEIHSENILPIIKKWLYSDRDIFVRELISNACDAIQKTKILRDQGECVVNDDDFRIDVTIDPEKHTLTFADNGVGMSAEEVKKYIAQIAFSGAEDFVSKYTSNVEGDQMIGHFGLGFYSAYMVADQVEVNTLSYREGAEPVLWRCDGSSDYEIETGTRSQRGTEIILHIGKEHQECLETSYIKKILSHYCSFLPYPIYLGGQRINEQTPLWIKSPSECSEKEYLDFYRYLYPSEPDPLFWIHLNVDYPFHLKGILYFPKINQQQDPKKSSVSLYCNRVFVADHCKEVIPEYLTMLRGVIDSPDIPLNVSRSYLQMDKTVRQLANHISKKVTDSLSTLYKTDRDRFVKAWQDVSIVVKLGALEDEKFYERAKEFLIWENVDGKWTTIQDYLERNGEKTKNKVFYTIDARHGGHFLQMYKEKGVETLCMGAAIDGYLIHFLEGKIPSVSFQRIDAEIHEDLIDKTREKTILDLEGKTEASRLAEFVRSKMDDETIEVEAKSLAEDGIPGFVLLDEQQRRMRDYMIRFQPEQEGGNALLSFGKKTFVVNTNNRLICAAHQLDQTKPELAKELVHELYDLALLSQREMLPADLNEFVGRSNRILEKLTTAILES